MFKYTFKLIYFTLKKFRKNILNAKLKFKLKKVILIKIKLIKLCKKNILLPLFCFYFI